MGISSINQTREQNKVNRESFNDGPKNLWLKDKDQAYVSILATGKEGDDLLGAVYIHGLEKVASSGKKYFIDILCKNKHEGTSCEFCDNGNRPKHKFGFWAYVHYIDHSNQNKENSWTAEKTAGGQTIYREKVEDIMMFSQGFGQKDYLWNFLVDIFQEMGSLDKKVVRIKRTGVGQTDTLYQILTQSSDSVLPNNIIEKKKTLPTVIDFFKNQAETKLSKQTVVPVSLSSDDDNEIFGGMSSSSGDDEAESKLF